MTEEANGLATRLTRVYIKMRDTRAELKAEFDAKDRELKEKQERVKQELLKYCKENDLNSASNGAGSFYRTVKQRFWTSDWADMHKFIQDRGLIEFMEKRLNQTAVREYLAENPDDRPNSLEVSSEYQLTVKKAAKK